MQGSAGFRHVFLGRGARVIVVGTPVEPQLQADNFGASSFYELPYYFPVSDYSIIKYPMDPRAPEWETNFTLHDVRDLKFGIYYQRDVTLNISRMSGYARSALHEGRSSSHWLSRPGSLKGHSDHSLQSTVPAEFSGHLCFGETAMLRSCLFHNLYNNTEGNGTWVYFEDPEAPPAIKRGGQSSVAYDFGVPPLTGASNGTDGYFFSPEFVRHEGAGGRDDIRLSVTLQRRSPPPASEVDLHLDVSLLWSFYGPSNHSHGHCLLNDWLPMFTTLDYHFADNIPPFRILMADPNADVQVCLKYIESFSLRPPVLHLSEAVARATQTGKKWLRFSYLVVGDGNAQSQTIRATLEGRLPTTPSAYFNVRSWRRFRRAMYVAQGLSAYADVVPGSGATLNRITVATPIALPGKDQRHKILNAGELVAHLNSEFPNATTCLVNIGRLNMTEQLLVMANTSVFITT